MDKFEKLRERAKVWRLNGSVKITCEEVDELLDAAEQCEFWRENEKIQRDYKARCEQAEEVARQHCADSVLYRNRCEQLEVALRKSVEFFGNHRTILIGSMVDRRREDILGIAAAALKESQ